MHHFLESRLICFLHKDFHHLDLIQGVLGLDIYSYFLIFLSSQSSTLFSISISFFSKKKSSKGVIVLIKTSFSATLESDSKIFLYLTASSSSIL